ncbi:MAG: hypothetical protein KGZ97_08520 [Bacteroidetes bacterium]|nr:hypothetical protein [Bacteroidota bacterium]
MKKLIFTLCILLVTVVTVVSQSPLGFNYQAVIRNAAGEIIANQEVGIEISILQGSVSGTVVYSEDFFPETNDFGLINLIIGSGAAKVGSFAGINWSTANYFIKIAVDINGGTSFVEMGTTQLLSVPFANYAFSTAQVSSAWEETEDAVSTSKKVGIGTETPTAMLEVKSDGTKDDETPLFEVKNSKGETVFAVYENSVKIFIDESSGDDKTRGGFAVSGRTTSKETNEILVVTPEKTRVYVDESTEKTRGGFAVSGKTTSKQEDSLFFLVQPNLTQVFVAESTEKTRGGFAVSGKTTSKEGAEDIFRVTPGLTEVFIDETADSKTRGGFAVSGKTTSKEEGYYDIFKVIPERTDVFIKPNEDKFFPDGFTISAYGQDFTSTELFSVSQSGTFVYTAFGVAPKVATADVIEIGQTYALAGGTILEYGGSTVWQAGVVYSTSQNPTINWEAPITSSYGVVMSMEFMGGTGDFTAQLEYLNPETTYYVRAFGINEEGLIGYGPQKSFVTDEPFMVTFEVFSIWEEPIDNATITVFNNGSPFKTNIIVNEPGDYIFYLAMGEYMYSVSAPGYYDYTGSMFIEGSEHYEPVYLDPKPNTVTFNVIDITTDQPIPWMTIYIEEVDNWDNFHMTNSDENGIATAELFPALYNFWVEDYGYVYEYFSGQIEVIQGEDLVVNVFLTPRPKYTVEVTVYKPGMTELSVDAEVSLFSEGGMPKDGPLNEYSQYLYTDANGKVLFTDVPEGSYELSSWHNDDGSYWDYLWVEGNLNIDIELGWKKDENKETKSKPERKPRRQFRSEKAPRISIKD